MLLAYTPLECVMSANCSCNHALAGRVWMSTRAAIATIVVSSVPAVVHAQWTVTNLHPQGEWSASFSLGASSARQVWRIVPDGGFIGGPPSYASVWLGSAGSCVNLHPDGEQWTDSEALGAVEHQQVGQVMFINRFGHPGMVQRAALWRDTAESLVVLSSNPSCALATSGINQVGWVAPGADSHASLWSGTPESLVDLHPTGTTASIALATAGAQQVGVADGHAGLWQGTAESWVDLHPAGASTSRALGTTGMHQVGEAVIGGELHAGLWNGAASSWVDLNPAGCLGSSASATVGAWQVGAASQGDGTHASLWNGTAESWEDLSLALPGSWIDTYATGIWSDGSTLSITGYGVNIDTQRFEALLWSRPIPAPSTLTWLAATGMIAARRRRVTP